ncbi:hypothetical protein C1H46_013829 [Malus baccata]|uniref:Proteasome subunit beta n=1 Tax=Malus baccata TaxID=106549 RepID=A0A540MP93_MALBA|nr:hypothetical protein C1H46_013829 [Malus baccata]
MASSDMDLNAPHSMGTTIISVTYDGGVVLGADSRTSTGVYVANRASDKITQLTDNVYVCRSGSAADFQVVSDYVRYFLHQHTIQLGQPATVKVCANLVRLLSYGNKNMLETGLIVGGWDKYEGGKMYGIPLGGTLLELPFAIGGMLCWSISYFIVEFLLFGCFVLTFDLVQQWGAAYSVRGGLEREKLAMEYLERRECEYDSKTLVDFYKEGEFSQSEPFLTGVIVFTSTLDKESNKCYLGPAPLEDMARQIATAFGPCVNNRDYLFLLEKAMFDIGHEEDHVIELANEVRKVLGITG